MSSMDDTTRDVAARLREGASDAAYLIRTRGGSNDLALLEQLLPVVSSLMATVVGATANVIATGAAENHDGLPAESNLL